MKQVISLTMTLLLLASCSQDTSLTPGTSGSGAATALEVDDTVLEKSVETRAATTLATDGATIGIFCSKETGYDAAQVNIPYVYATATSKWAPKEAAKPVWLLAYDANVCAYYPYNEAYTDNTAIPLATAVYTTAGDICFAPNRAMNGTPAKSKTRFDMQRAMAMMRFTLKKGDYPGTCKVSAVTLKNDSLPATGTINITAGTNTAVAVKKADFSYTPAAAIGGADGSVTPTTAGVKVQDVLLVPFALKGDFSVILTVDGKLMQTDLPPATFTDSKIEAGKRYMLTLKVNGTALNVTDVTIEDWTDVPMTATGGTDFEPLPAGGGDPIDIGLSFLIAPGNVRAIKPAGSSTYKYKIAEEQGYYSGVDGAVYVPSGGDYFCWNTLDPNQIDVTQSPWEDSRDPCRQIGEGQWYTPTEDQLQKLKDMYTNKNTVWGTYEMEDGTKKNGTYFGTATVPAKADRDKYVFLPAAGYRSNVSPGTIISEGSGGYYRSSTPNTSDATGAYYLSFNNIAVHGNQNSDFRSYGVSLRCVKDKPKEPIDIGLDFLIAPGNVRAIKQADNTYKYDFAEEQGYYSGDGSGGDYFCWNTLDPAATTNSNTTDVWDPNSDPCRKIGDGQWSTPTQAQLQKLADLYSYAGKAVWRTYTMKDGTKVNGIYFGTSTAPSKTDQDKYVFLPAAGNRNGTGWASLGSSGYYWSSTPNGSNAYYLYFYSGNCYLSNYYRYHGFSVRCVRNK